MAFNVLTIYNSTDAESIAAAALSKLKYPQTSLEDTAGLTTGQITTMIATYGAATQHRIMACVNSAFVSAVASEGNIDITTAGDDNDMAVVTVNDGTDTFVLGFYDVQTGDTNALVVDGLVASINGLTSYHGWSATDNGDDFDVTAPIALGATANGYTLGLSTSTGGTTAQTITALGTTTLGVTQVGAAGDLTAAQITTLDTKLIVDPTADLATQQFDSPSDGKLRPVLVWELLYPTLTRPLIVNDLGDYQDDNDEFSGTATAGAATTITDSGQAWTIDEMIGKQVSITGGTGSGQTRTVSDNTATVLTVSNAWGVTPDGTSVYSITPAPTANTNFEDVDKYVRTYLQDLSLGATVEVWRSLVDDDGNIDNKSAGQSTGQDLVVLEDIRARGNNMSDFAAL